MKASLAKGYVARFVVCASIASAVGSTGCTSMHRVPLVAVTPRPPAYDVSPGDEVHVTLREGGDFRFTVRAVETDAIISEDGTRYDLDDIDSVERLGFSGARTTILVAGTWGVLFLLSYGLALASILGGAP